MLKETQNAIRTCNSETSSRMPKSKSSESRIRSIINVNVLTNEQQEHLSKVFWGFLFLAALAALYLTLVSEWVSESVTDRHFRILTQIVTFETWHPSDIWLFKKRWRKNWFVWKKEVEKSWKKSVKKKHKKTEKCWNF